MIMLDLCSGLGGASAAMKDRGWEVTTVDINPAFEPDIVEDVKTFTWARKEVDLIWASPPCNEFAREFFVWSKTGKSPDLSIVQACYRIIKECDPDYWVIENVRGAKKYFYPLLGSPSLIIYPYYFWGHFPPITRPYKINRRHKQSFSSNRSAERAKIPYEISLAFCKSIELQLRMSI